MVPTKKDADALTMIVWIGELVESTIVYMCLVTKNMVKETMDDIEANIIITQQLNGD